MSGIFARPEWIPVATAALATSAVGLALALWRGRRRLQAWLGTGALSLPWGAGVDLWLLAALAGIGLALAGPRWAERAVAVPTAGVDLVLLLDVSRSMDARDVAPSRLARARRAAVELLSGLAPGHRVGLAAFAGRGLALAPLTPDRSALRELLSALDSGLIASGGSDIAHGLAVAERLLRAGDERPRAIVLLSDGEARPRALGAAASRLARRGIPVIAVALGRDEGAIVPDGTAALRDGRGAIVTSRRRSEPLRTLAQTTGGIFLAGDARGLVAVERAISTLEGWRARGPGETALERRRVPATAPLAALAFACLVAGSFGRPGARPGRAWRGAARVAWLATIALAGVATTAAGPGEVEDGEARRAFARALQAAERDDWRSAERSFAVAATAARGPDLGARALHNLGVAMLRREAWEPARSAFLDSLALRPGDLETRFNLEWTLAQAGRAGPGPGERPSGRAADAAERGSGGDGGPGRSAGAGGRGSAEAQRSPAREGSAIRRAAGSPPPAPGSRAATGPGPTRSGVDAAGAGIDGEGARAGPAAPPDGPAGGSTDGSAGAGGPRPTAPAATPLRPPRLDAAERQRWLSLVRDDPTLGLRSAAAAESPGRGWAPEW